MPLRGIPLLIAAAVSLPLLVNGRCLVGQSCFPSALELAAFNASVGGRLFSQRPIGAVCYATDPLFNPAQCHNQSTSISSDQWLSDQPPAYEQPNWEACGSADSCEISNPLNSTATCGQGSVPGYAVHAQTPEDVISYVKFAVKHDLRIVVKNTGHDFKGRSAGKGGFSLWTHLLNSTTRNPSFVPKGCKIPPQDSATLGSGVQWLTAYRFAEQQNITLVGGDKPQVGAAGGWVLGAGHSFLSPTFGLGVDNILEADIVTPDGVLQTVSVCSNPDLFWAIRGGGGATFGILVSVTYKAHPVTPISFTFAAPVGNRTLGLNDTRILVNSLATSALHLADLGLGGIIYNDPYEAYALFILPGGNQALLENATAPFFESAKDVLENTGYFTLPSFYQFFSNIETPDSISGLSLALSSRLIPRSHFTPSNIPALVDAVQEGQEIMAKSGFVQEFQIIMAPPTRAGLNNANNTSINPIWYDSLWHVIYSSDWAANAPIHQAAQPLRALTPGAGAYQNEADVYEPNHQQSYWGSNYPRLLDIKRRVDPANVLQVWHGVGFDESSNDFDCYSQ